MRGRCLLLLYRVTSVSPPAAVLPPPAAAPEKKKILWTPDSRTTQNKWTSLLRKLRSTKAVTHCSNAHRSMTRTQPMTHITSAVATVCCLWLVATTASRSACSHRTPTKPAWHLQQGAEAATLCFQDGKIAATLICQGCGTHTQAGVSSSTRKRQVPWKQKWRWVSGQSSKCDRTADATNSVRWPHKDNQALLCRSQINPTKAKNVHILDPFRQWASSDAFFTAKGVHN